MAQDQVLVTMSAGERDLGAICGCQAAPLDVVRFFSVESTQVIEEFKGRLLLRGVGKDKRKTKPPKN